MNAAAQRLNFRKFRQVMLLSVVGLMFSEHSGAAIFACVDADGKLLISSRQEDDRYRRFDPLHRVSAPKFGVSTAAESGQADHRPWQAFAAIIDQIAREVGVSPHLLHAVIEVESAYNPEAISSKGAQGLMQLIPATAARFQVQEVNDPTSNIRAGAKYLKLLLERFHNDLSLALAAYNAGEGTVQRYHNTMPPFPETEAYVKRVLALFEQGMNGKRPRS